MAAGNFLPHRFLIIEGLARLIDVGQFNRLADSYFSCIGRFQAGYDAKQSRFSGSVCADNPDNRSTRNLEVQVVDQQPVPECFTQSVGLDYQVSKSRSRRYIDLIGFLSDLKFFGGQLLESAESGFALRLARFGIGAHPLKFGLNRFLAGGFLLFLDFQACVFLLQP